MKITTLCDPLCSPWFNLPYHNRILRKSEKVHALANYQRANKLAACAWGILCRIGSNVSCTGCRYIRDECGMRSGEVNSDGVKLDSKTLCAGFGLKSGVY